MRSGVVSAFVIGIVCALMVGKVSRAGAETISQALASTYADNPEINSARANTRAVDENVPLARSGLRPVISAFHNGTVSSSENAFSSFETVTYAAALGLQVEQPLFRGFRTVNAIKEAKSSVLARRELLRNTVQNVLFETAEAYMGFILTTEVVNLRRKNVAFLMEQVRGIQERFAVGDLTRTDVAQAQSRLGIGRANLARAEDVLERQRADYRRLVGHDPVALRQAFPYQRLIPKVLDEAVSLGLDQHPIILQALHLVEAQAFAVKQEEGLLLPTVSLLGAITHNETFFAETNDLFDWSRSWSNSVAAGGRIDIPLFQGGAVSARIRQAKELLGQQKIEVDLARDQVRDATVSAWADVQTTRRTIDAAKQAVDAAELALSGVQKEVRVGQRSTLDVLDAQQELLNDREALVGAERDLIVAQFSLLSAMGELTAEALNLPTQVYDPRSHYEAVKNRVFDSSTPDGR